MQQHVITIIAISLFLFGLGNVEGGLRDCNDEGHIIISDQFNNRVIEVNKRTKEIVWSFGDGSPNPGPNSIGAPNDALRAESYTLISGTGTTDVPDNRVIIVNEHGHIVQTIENFENDVSTPINTPVCAIFVPQSNNVLNEDLIITDQVNSRIIQTHRNNDGSYEETVLFDALQVPNSAELYRIEGKRHLLVTDEAAGLVYEVNLDVVPHAIVWQYPSNPDCTKLSAPAFASRLPNGHYLITDAAGPSDNCAPSGVIEVNRQGDVVWRYETRGTTATFSSQPTRAVRLCNGNTLISDQFNHQVIEINRDRQIVWEYGHYQQEGTGAGFLNAPYDAKVIGDFTGLTLPTRDE